MKRLSARWLSARGSCSLIVAVATTPLIALAQSAAAPGVAAAPASAAASATKPVGPRLPTAAERRDSADATSAPDLRPDRPVVPQINIPLGRKKAAASSPTSLDDSAAACESKPVGLERAACRKRAAEARKPN